MVKLEWGINGSATFLERRKKRCVYLGEKNARYTGKIVTGGSTHIGEGSGGVSGGWLLTFTSDPHESRKKESGKEVGSM